MTQNKIDMKAKMVRVDDETNEAIEVWLLRQKLAKKEPNTFQGLIEHLLAAHRRRHRI